MDFSLTHKQLDLRKQHVEFAEKALEHSVLEQDESSSFSIENWKKCADFGILRGTVPKAYGGFGRDVLTNVIILEALGYGCRDNGLTLGVNSLLWTILEPIMTFGSEEQKRHYLPKLCSGEWIAADAITEEQAGSDALSMKTRAIRKDGGYVLNGKKCYVGFAPIADVFLVFAKTDPEAGVWGFSAFLLEADTKGLKKSENRKKMGLRTLPTGDIILEDCFVPEENRLGPEGIGMGMFSSTMEWERSFILASHVGAMARQLEICIEYSRSRKQFGKPISEFQSVSNRLADMKLRLETSQLLLYKAAWLKDQGDKSALQAALTNLHISESFLHSSLEANRLHGAKGYLSEFEIERDLRDAVGGVIYAGTSDIQRNLISRILLS